MVSSTYIRLALVFALNRFRSALPSVLLGDRYGTRQRTWLVENDVVHFRYGYKSLLLTSADLLKHLLHLWRPYTEFKQVYLINSPHQYSWRIIRLMHVRRFEIFRQPTRWYMNFATSVGARNRDFATRVLVFSTFRQYNCSEIHVSASRPAN